MVNGRWKMFVVNDEWIEFVVNGEWKGFVCCISHRVHGVD